MKITEHNVVINTAAMIVRGDYATLDLADAVGQAMTDDYYIAGDAEDLRRFGGNELVRLYNGLTGSDLKKFRDKDTAVERTWEAVILHVTMADNAPEVATEQQPAKMIPDPITKVTPKSKAKAKATTPKIKRKNVAPGSGGKVDILPKPLGEQKSCLQGSKQAELVTRLSDPNGATMYELSVALGQAGKPWTVPAIQSGFSWDVRSVKGYGVRTEYHNGEWLYENGHEACAADLGYEGQRLETYDEKVVMPVYFLVLPKGMKAPLPHRESKSKK